MKAFNQCKCDSRLKIEPNECRDMNDCTSMIRVLGSKSNVTTFRGSHLLNVNAARLKIEPNECRAMTRCINYACAQSSSWKGHVVVIDAQ